MFRQVFTVSEKRYHIYVFGNITNVYFTMVLKAEGWTFYKPERVANWIRDIEVELNDAIVTNHI